MITHITKDNRAKYTRLFAQATDALKEGNAVNYPEEFSISSLEEYFQNLQELAELDTRFLRIPVDEEMFDIDLNTRQIIVPPSFKKVGLAVQGDDLAEVVYFKVDRFFDATDLNETFIMIQWEAPSGRKMASPAYFQEVDSETDKLIFGWAVTKEMTTSPGALKFSVSFVDGQIVSENNNEIDVTKLAYRLSTLVSSININAGLSLANQTVIKFEDRLKDLRSRIKNTPILGDDKYPEADPAVILNYLGFDWADERLVKNIFEELIDDPEATGVETGLPLLAISPNAGIISYKWFKEGSEDALAEGLGAIRYLPVAYTEDKKYPEAVYFIKEGTDNYRYFNEEKDSWMKLLDDGSEIINPLLYERIAFLGVEGPGNYYAEIVNKEGMKLSTVVTPKAVVPAPAEIDSITITAEDDNEIYEDGKAVALSSNITYVGNEEYAKPAFRWFRDGVEIEKATAAEYDAVAPGEYSVKVINHWNKAVSAEKLSNSWPIYPAAIEPVITSFEATLKHPVQGFVLTGSDLEVKFEAINQTKAEQYVRWFWSDNDDMPGSVDDDPDAWIEIVDENGVPFEGTVLTNVQEPGDYKAVVYNVITENNKKQTESEIIQVYKG